MDAISVLRAVAGHGKCPHLKGVLRPRCGHDCAHSLALGPTTTRYFSGAGYGLHQTINLTREQQVHTCLAGEEATRDCRRTLLARAEFQARMVEEEIEAARAAVISTAGC